MTPIIGISTSAAPVQNNPGRLLGIFYNNSMVLLKAFFFQVKSAFNSIPAMVAIANKGARFLTISSQCLMCSIPFDLASMVTPLNCDR